MGIWERTTDPEIIPHPVPREELRHRKDFWQFAGQASSSHSQYKMRCQSTCFAISDIWKHMSTRPQSSRPNTCQKRHVHTFQQGRRGWPQEGQREGQELDIRMCWNHIKSEPRTQTITLHSRPLPLCVAKYVKVTPHWQLAETCTFNKMVSRTTRRHFHVQEDIWTSVRTHESRPNNLTKTPLFPRSGSCQWGVSFTYSTTHSGSGREWNVNVCVLGSDLMWFQHILMSNSWPSRCPSCGHPLLPCWKVWP